MALGDLGLLISRVAPLRYSSCIMQCFLNIYVRRYIENHGLKTMAHQAQRGPEIVRPQQD